MPHRKQCKTQKEVKQYTEYWGGSDSIRERYESTKNTESSITLFIENIPILKKMMGYDDKNYEIYDKTNIWKHLEKCF